MLKKVFCSLLVLGILSVVPAAGLQETTYASSSNSQTYTVRWGDSLWKIANHYGTSVNALRQANNIWGNLLYAGQTISIPTSGNTSSGSTSSTDSDSGWRRLYVSDYERDLMARAVYSEAKGESYTGQVAVAAVVINRVHDPDYPGTIEGVIFEPWAFSPVHDGRFWMQPDSTAYSAVEDALKGWDPTYGATVFYNPVTAESPWVFTRPIITRIGNHVFAS
ncbi:cell wall hydrolase [Natranaerofaba carboxydovora]|uniref:cell wall hydrolase n=1 Tax=Natranaerofaba carboxydovora TaxID=2742683 RepID=UPI001F12E199|nr:cell wall hydrolase [Natranaerofaba carboxydovora]UMZ74516.1 Spore cortex-lytic enzyme [Natranaerofaba carboxydovora]